MQLPDEGDRHVLALAVHYEADVIVTWNSKDFPKAGTLKNRLVDGRTKKYEGPL